METYYVNIKCTNCGRKSDMEIQKGTPKNVAFANKECENCGCFRTTEDDNTPRWENPDRHFASIQS